MIPAELRARRLALGWTQAEAAAALGQSLRTYHRWEAEAVPAPELVDAALRWHETQATATPRRRGRPRKRLAPA